MTEIRVFDDPVFILAEALATYFPDVAIYDGTPAGWDWNTNDGPLVRLTDVGGNGLKWGVFQDAVIVVDVSAKSRSAAGELARLMHSVALEAPFNDLGIESIESQAKPIFDPEETAQMPAYVFRVRMTYRGTARPLPTDERP